MRAELRRLMEAASIACPMRFRQRLHLRAIEEMSVEDVALRWPCRGHRAHALFRARGLLRERLSRDVDLA